MYLRCPECRTRYEISSARIPTDGARVRCPRCRTVFQVSAPHNGTGPALPEAANSVRPGSPVEPDVARRIARALVSELLLGRREKRDEAIQKGVVLSMLGHDILDVYERYRERVGEQLALETRFFQEAVNEIIGDGETIL